MTHVIPTHIVDPLIAGPSTTKRTQAANLQQFIQDLLGDSHHTFLQGSYRNHTAISDLPDVDIVAVRTGTYSGTHSPHAGGRQTIDWSEIFSDLIAKLKAQRTYTWTLEEKEKCIKITGALNADVVPAVKYHHDHTIDPIVIRSSAGERLSHPRTHIENGELKNSVTNENFKPTVRMFKKWVDNHFGNSDVISSHKVEALVHDSDNSNFFDDPVTSFLCVGSTISEKLKPQAFPIAIYSVCGTENILSSWDAGDRSVFINRLNSSLQSGLAAYKATTSGESERHWRAAFNM